MASDETSDEKIVYTAKANFATNGPIILSLIGFIFSILILFPRSCKSDKVYHDLELSNKTQLVEKIFSNRIKRLNAKIDSLQKRIGTTSDATKVSSIEDSIKKLQVAIGTTDRDSFNLVHNNVDTSLSYFAKYLFLNRNSYRAAIDSLQGNNSIKVFVGLFDTTAVIDSSPFFQNDSLVISKKPLGLIPLFNKYPNFGFWFFFSIAQMTLWFLIATLVIGVTKRTDKVYKPLTYDPKNALYFSIIPVITMGIFIWLLYWKLIENYVIEDSYFLDLFNSKMLWYSTPGYLVAILCFGSYLFLSNKLEILNKDAQKANEELSTDDELKAKYKELKSAFDTTFLFSAIILSVFVLWMGIMFNAVNGIEAMRFYSQLSRSPFISYDFVYLIGLMHSLLLLIFYVPVRLRFNSLELKKEDDAIAKAQSSNKYLKAFWESIGTVLVTASPLITTILQRFISNLFGA